MPQTKDNQQKTAQLISGNTTYEEYANTFQFTNGTQTDIWSGLKSSKGGRSLCQLHNRLYDIKSIKRKKTKQAKLQ